MMRRFPSTEIPYLECKILAKYMREGNALGENVSPNSFVAKPPPQLIYLIIREKS